MTIDTTVPKERAVLVGVTLPKTTEAETEESLAELGRLAKTLGYQVVGTLSQRRGSLSGAVVLGAGKLKELARFTGGTGVLERKSYAKKTKAAARFEDAEDADDDDSDDEDPDDLADDEFDEEDEVADSDDAAPIEADVIIFDCELSPSQLSNLESATGVEVYDRTGVIVEIFSRHARTRAAKLQVEIARLRYLAPRVRVTGSGPGDKKGKAGEKGLELDKRKIRDRIAELRQEIADLEKEQTTGRSSRSDQCSVALVGYTNAGKSSMMRALTGSAVLVEDKLFATLDTTVRTLAPASIPRILVSDTVGFIKKLPTDLVASFHSTLEEARNADHLLYVVDASDPSFRSQLQTTREVLASIEADQSPAHLILNKTDKLTSEELASLLEEFPEAIGVSTKSAQSMAELRDRIIGFFEQDMADFEVFVPYTAHGAVGPLRAKVRVLAERHGDEGTFFQVRGRQETVAKLRRELSL
jgi:GTP-binding protein HflX